MLQELKSFITNKGMDEYILRLKTLREFFNKKKRQYAILTLILLILLPVELITLLFFEVGDKKLSVNNVLVLLSTFSGIAIIITGFFFIISFNKYLTFKHAAKLISSLIEELSFKKDVEDMIKTSKVFITRLSKELSLPRTYIVKRLIFKRKGVPYVI